MKEFAIKLNNIPSLYNSFTTAVLNYVKKKPSRFETVKNFMKSLPSSNSSDVLLFISQQPDFYEDSVQ